MFDEINVLAQETASDAGAANVAAPTFDYDLSELASFLDQFETIPEAFYEIGKNIAEAINRWMADIDWDAIFTRAHMVPAPLILKSVVDIYYRIFDA